MSSIMFRFEVFNFYLVFSSFAVLEAHHFLRSVMHAFLEFALLLIGELLSDLSYLLCSFGLFGVDHFQPQHRLRFLLIHAGQCIGINFAGCKNKNIG